MAFLPSRQEWRAETNRRSTEALEPLEPSELPESVLWWTTPGPMEIINMVHLALFTFS